MVVCLNSDRSHLKRPWSGTGPARGELASAPYRLSPGQAVPFLHALPEGVPTADQNLLCLLLARLGLEVVFVVGQGLQKEGDIRHVLTSPHVFQLLATTGKSQTKTSRVGPLVVQKLRLQAANAGDLGSIPGQGTSYHMRQLRVHLLPLKILQDGSDEDRRSHVPQLRSGAPK